MKPQQKFFVRLLLISLLMIGSGWTLINSIDTGETWRILFSAIGFLVFTTLTILLIRSYNNKAGGEKRNQDDK